MRLFFTIILLMLNCTNNNKNIQFTVPKQDSVFEYPPKEFYDQGIQLIINMGKVAK